MPEEINNTASTTDADEQSQPQLTIQEKLAMAGVRHRPLSANHGEITRKLQEAGIRHSGISCSQFDFLGLMPAFTEGKFNRRKASGCESP